MSPYFIYFLIGFSYWLFNLTVRKLHLKNEEGEGWFLAPFWLLGWPLCFIMLIAGWISDKHKSSKY